MVNYKTYTSISKPDSIEREAIVSFLYTHLDEYGDAKEDIEKAIIYAVKDEPAGGGFVLVAKENDEIVGAVVINRTGMEGYIPENILVYIAVHESQRGKGLGKGLMKEVIKISNGDIALHVEPENPARFLYEKVGFSSKYVEMRLKK
ncbi:GNAT family N-acetyltransferase [Labilibaculum sp. A4]|uniref:GNAT family N-acetyltransferase n=2 Tax=Labilibaculum TaxID=2060722 RepID=A0A425Y9Q1_9BACT|nr:MULTISPECIES: GNAT family N-acetyltransferase [Labilibaculum]MDQ1771703.1 GNAT family N-acetyltransferase [Labilibaculum euxinus]MUP36968.1 GNAT family N-acetyltransferase [Labilibaculum euxinus]MVB06173.1 GNAT family N-acetyltransferase [Labilibaculum euxinus]MWN77308.1 GNAT family N-acetyltransferase [Labilibaculum euxinus]PKQ66665.1 GNAT family N-acetyltransferase [Labilibaculum manganireducens]